MLTIPTYPDVPPSHWAYKRIGWARLLGIMGARDGVNFYPDAPVTNLEAQQAAACTFGWMLFIPSVALGGYAYLKLKR